jgi:hypothetical protein
MSGSMNDQNKKTLRQFQCRDYLWEIFEQMSVELECSTDYLVNEAMRQYARSRNYGAQSGQMGAVSGAPAAPIPTAPPPRGPSMSQSTPGYPAPPIQAPARPAAPAPYGAGYPQPSSPGAYPAPPNQSIGGYPPPAQTYPAGGGGYPAPAAAYPPNNAYGQAPAYPAPAPQPADAAPQPQGYPAPQAPQGYGGGGGYPAPQARPAPSAPPGSSFPPPPGRGAPPPLPAGGNVPPPGQLLYVIFNGQKFPVNKEEFIIGRGAKTADLPIKDGNISRRHAAIIMQNGQYFMKDLGSTNGVEYQGRRVDGRRIEEGDVYQLCDYELRFTYR